MEFCSRVFYRIIWLTLTGSCNTKLEPADSLELAQYVSCNGCQTVVQQQDVSRMHWLYALAACTAISDS